MSNNISNFNLINFSDKNGCQPKVNLKKKVTSFVKNNIEKSLQINTTHKKISNINVYELENNNLVILNDYNNIQNLEEIKTIGHGGYSVITLVKDTVNNKKYAFKKFFYLKDLYSELFFFENVPEHYNIVKCFGIHTIKAKQGLLLEYIQGFDFSKITKCLCQQYLDNNLSHIGFWGTIQYLIYNILLGIQHIHDYNFAHQDIRPSNILIDQNKLHPIIIDFNLVRHHGETLSPGKEEYASPEFFTSNGKSKISEITDSYSIGQLLYTILFNIISPDTANIFVAGAKINDLKSCERFAIIYRLKHALQDYTKINDRGEYKKAIKSLKITDENTDTKNKISEHHDSNNNSATKQGLVGFYPDGYESHLVKFINQMMHPDSELRLMVKKAFDHEFIKEQIIDESSAQNFIKIALDTVEKKYPSNKLHQDSEFLC